MRRGWFLILWANVVFGMLWWFFFEQETAQGPAPPRKQSFAPLITADQPEPLSRSAAVNSSPGANHAPSLLRENESRSVTVTSSPSISTAAPTTSVTVTSTPSISAATLSTPAQAGLPRCSLYQDIQGAWVQSPNELDVIPYNCSVAVEVPIHHWACWDRPFDTRWNEARPDHHDRRRIHDTFDTTRAPPDLACTVDELPRDVAALGQLLHGRSFFFVGDSLSEQLYHTLTCELSAVFHVNLTRMGTQLRLCDLGDDLEDDEFLQSVQNFSCESENPGRDFWLNCCQTTMHCYNSLPTDSFAVRICHAFSSFKFIATAARVTYALVRRFGATARDIVLANEGVHFLSNRVKWRYIRNEVPVRTSDWIRAVRRIQERMGDRTPTFLWRETSAQHFLGVSGTGEFPADEDQPHTCGPLHAPNNTIGKLATPLVESAGIPILRMWNASAQRHFEHPELMMMFDCTHFCLPSGALRHFVRLFLHHVKTLAMLGGPFA